MKKSVQKLTNRVEILTKKINYQDFCIPANQKKLTIIEKRIVIVRKEIKITRTITTQKQN